MLTAYLDGVWYIYDQPVPLPHVLQQGETVYWSDDNGDWQKLPLASLSALQVKYEVITPTKMTLQQVYTHLFVTAQRYTGIWSATLNICEWLQYSEAHARGKVKTALANTETLLDVPEALYDPTLLNYLRERASTLRDFLLTCEKVTYQ